MTYMSITDVTVLGEKQIHPLIESIHEETAAICQALGVKRGNHSEHTTMVSYMFPNARHFNHLVKINVISDILYYIDDVYNDDRMLATDSALRQIFAEALAILHGKAIKPQHQLHYLASYIRQMFSDAPVAWQKRFYGSLQDFFVATTDSLAVVNQNGRLSADAYILHREKVSGMYTSLDEIEYAYEIYLPDSVHQTPQFQHMRQVCAQYCALLNDIFSYYKEVMLTGTDYNLIKILQSSAGMGFEQAVHETVNYLNGLVEEFKQLEAKMPIWEDKTVNDAVALYIDAMKDQMIAAWHWQWATNRYRSAESPFQALRQPVVAEV